MNAIKKMLRDKRLSFRARGVLALILTKPPGETFYQGWLYSQGTEGREAIRSALDELKRLGYATCTKEKRADGKIAYVWVFDSVPTKGQQ